MILAVFLLLSTALVTAERVNVGDVTIWNDDYFLYVKYDSAKDWSFDQTHLLIGESEDKIIDIPQYVVSHDHADSYTYKIMLAGAPGDLYVVAQAKITHPEKGTHDTVWEIGEFKLKENTHFSRLRDALNNMF